MKTLIIYPNENGHFLNYCNIIKENDKENIISLMSSNIYEIIKYCHQNKIIKVVFLSGDSDCIKSLLLKCIFPSLNISIIIYYSFKNIGLKFFLKKILLNFLTYVNIRLLLLEGELSSVKYASQKSLKIIHDPSLLNYSNNKETRKSKIKIHYLVAGYLDERKSIRLLFKVLNNLSKIDSKKRIITLIGEQTNSTKKFLLNFKKVSNIEIVQKNYRYDDSELEEELYKCDLVWAVYNNHRGSSGIVINAIQFNKPVIFIPTGVLKSFADELKIDELPKDSSETEIEECLLRLEIEKQYSFESRTKFLNKRDKNIFINSLLN